MKPPSRASSRSCTPSGNPAGYNVAPTQDVPVVRVNKAGEHIGTLMHLDLIPFWATGVHPKYSTINATVEKLTEAATWRGPWQRGQRCILPALGFYEWQIQADGKIKQPFYITLNNQGVFGFAGLWDKSTREDGVVIASCTIVTMPANQLMREIHNAIHRMPAILAKEDRETWLSGSVEPSMETTRWWTNWDRVSDRHSISA